MNPELSMFKSLRDKLKGFFGKEEPKKEKKTKKKEPKAKPAKKEPKKEKKKLPTDKQLKKQAEELKEVPKKFSSGSLQYQPDLEKVENLKKAEEGKESGFLSKIFKKTEAEERQRLDLEQEESKEDTEEEKEQVEEEKPSFLKRFTSKLTTSTLEKKHIEEIFEPLELILLENNVNLATVDKIRENLEKDLIGVEVKKDKIEETIIQSLKSSIESVLIEPPNLIDAIKQKNKTGEAYTIVFFGINGSGKTTSIAKLAYKLKKLGVKPVLAAGDTFRAASIEQLKTHAQRIDVPIIAHDYGSDPAAIAFDAKAYAEKHKLQVVLVDTAGRMYTKSNLMKEMEKIIRVSKPDLKIFVAESITGNDATQQASMFNEAIGIDGIILTKADVDEKGGAALSVSQVTGKPIYFLGQGQGYEDLKDFKKSDIIKNLGLE